MADLNHVDLTQLMEWVDATAESLHSISISVARIADNLDRREGRFCDALHIESGAHCFLDRNEPHGPNHHAWAHHPGQLVVWSVKEDNDALSG